MKMSYFESPLEGLLDQSIRNQYSGNNLRIRRYEVGLGQRELERRAGINHPNVNYWENGKCKPEQENIIKMMEALYEASRDKNAELCRENKRFLEWISELQERIKEMQDELEEE